MTVAPVRPADVERDMGALPLFEGVPGRAVKRLVAEGHLRDFRRGTYLFHQGDEAPDVCFLVRGRVEISTLSASGNRQLHTTLNKPTFVGELGVVGDVPRTASALALEDTVVWSVPGDSFLDVLTAEPPASRALLQAIVRQLLENEAFVDDLLFLDLKGRVAKRLIQLVSPSLEELPKDGVELPAIVTHADLASLCGGSRENVTRILSEFQKRGLISRDGRRYRLKKVSGLAKLAGL